MGLIHVQVCGKIRHNKDNGNSFFCCLNIPLGCFHVAWFCGFILAVKNQCVSRVKITFTAFQYYCIAKPWLITVKCIRFCMFCFDAFFYCNKTAPRESTVRVRPHAPEVVWICCSQGHALSCGHRWPHEFANDITSRYPEVFCGVSALYP